jgi:hypothetical protein
MSRHTTAHRPGRVRPHGARRSSARAAWTKGCLAALALLSALAPTAPAAEQDPFFSAAERFYTLYIKEYPGIAESEVAVESYRERGYPAYWVGERRSTGARVVLLIQTGLYPDRGLAEHLRDYFGRREGYEPRVQSVSFATRWSHWIPAVREFRRLAPVGLGRGADARVLSAAGGAFLGVFLPPAAETTGRFVAWNEKAKEAQVLEDVGAALLGPDSARVYLRTGDGPRAFALDPWQEVEAVGEAPQGSVELIPIGKVREVETTEGWRYREKSRGVFLVRRRDLVVAPGRLCGVLGDGERVVILDDDWGEDSGIYLFTLEYYRYERKIHSE